MTPTPLVATRIICSARRAIRRAASYGRDAPGVDVGDQVAAGVVVAGAGAIGHVGREALGGRQPGPLADQEDDHGRVEQLADVVEHADAAVADEERPAEPPAAARGLGCERGRSAGTCAATAAADRPSPIATWKSARAGSAPRSRPAPTRRATGPGRAGAGTRAFVVQASVATSNSPHSRHELRAQVARRGRARPSRRRGPRRGRRGAPARSLSGTTPRRGRPGSAPGVRASRRDRGASNGPAIGCALWPRRAQWLATGPCMLPRPVEAPWPGRACRWPSDGAGPGTGGARRRTRRRPAPAAEAARRPRPIARWAAACRSRSAPGSPTHAQPRPAAGYQRPRSQGPIAVQVRP